MPACEVAARPVLAHVDARRVDGERQGPVQRPLGGEDVAQPLARLDRRGDPGHRRRRAAPRAGRVDDDAARDLLARREAHRLDPAAIRRQAHPHHRIGNVLHAARTGRAGEAGEQVVPVEIAFVAGVEAAADDVVQHVEGKARGDLVRREDGGARSLGRLHRLVGLQRGGESGIVSQIEVADLVQPQLRHLVPAAEPGAEIAHEFRAELRAAHIDRIRILLADAAVGERGGRLRVARVALDDEDAAGKARMLGQEPRGRRAVHRPADDDDIVGRAGRPVRESGGQHGRSSRGIFRWSILPDLGHARHGSCRMAAVMQRTGGPVRRSSDTAPRAKRMMTERPPWHSMTARAAR